MPLLNRTLALFLFLHIAACADSSGDNQAEQDLESRARGIHERVITLDTHVDINPNNFTEERNYTMDLETQVNLPKMEEGGLDVAWFVVYVGQGELTDDAFASAYDEAIAKFDAIHWLAEEKAPERIELAYTSDDVRRIAAEGKKVAMIGVENGYPVGTNLDNIREFAERGARYLSLSHNGHSQLSDSNTGERDDTWLHGGLSDLGREAVAELNKWGIMIDLSHPSKESNMEVMRISRAPVMASHSSARALSDVSRNMDDEQLMALKENGGVIQTVAFRSYVNAEKDAAYRDAVNALRSEIAESMGIAVITNRREFFQMSQEERQSYRDRVAPVEEAVQERMAEIEAEPVNVADFCRPHRLHG